MLDHKLQALRCFDLIFRFIRALRTSRRRIPVLACALLLTGCNGPGIGVLSPQRGQTGGAVWLFLHLDRCTAEQGLDPDLLHQVDPISTAQRLQPAARPGTGTTLCHIYATRRASHERWRDTPVRYDLLLERTGTQVRGILSVNNKMIPNSHFGVQGVWDGHRMELSLSQLRGTEISDPPTRMSMRGWM